MFKNRGWLEKLKLIIFVLFTGVLLMVVLALGILIVQDYFYDEKVEVFQEV